MNCPPCDKAKEEKRRLREGAHAVLVAEWPDNAGTDDLGLLPAAMQVDALLGQRDRSGWPTRDAAAPDED